MTRKHTELGRPTENLRHPEGASPLEDRQETGDRTAASLEEARDEHLRKYLRETDQAAVEQLSERYRHLVPAERLKKFQDLPTQFENQSQFDAGLRAKSIEQPADGRITGWSLGTHEAAHVDTEHLQVPKTIYHERLHQLSDPEGTRRLGELTGDPKLKEGLTEHYAIRELGIEPPPDAPTSYAERRATAAKLEQSLGCEKLERLYFKGEISEADEKRLTEAVSKADLEQLNREIAKLPRQA